MTMHIHGMFSTSVPLPDNKTLARELLNQDQIIYSKGVDIPLVSAGNGWLMVDDENGSASETIGPNTPLPGLENGPTITSFGTDVPVPANNWQPYPTPAVGQAHSVDGYISQNDRMIVSNLPVEGKQEFTKNVHEYIGQLEKDYLPQTPPREVTNGAG